MTTSMMATTMVEDVYISMSDECGMLQVSLLRVKLIFMWSRIRGIRDASDRSIRNLRNLAFEVTTENCSGLQLRLTLCLKVRNTRLRSPCVDYVTDDPVL